MFFIYTADHDVAINSEILREIRITECQGMYEVTGFTPFTPKAKETAYELYTSDIYDDAAEYMNLIISRINNRGHYND